jgi:hypothetical protein
MAEAAVRHDLPTGTLGDGRGEVAPHRDRSEALVQQDNRRAIGARVSPPRSLDASLPHSQATYRGVRFFTIQAGSLAPV